MNFPEKVRFWNKVDLKEGCWEWNAARTKAGYGVFGIKLDGVFCNKYAHRLAFEIFRGIIPVGLQIDHLCRNRGCCNPFHMEPVTSHINKSRGFSPCANNARKTHCPSGHEYSTQNTYLYKGLHRMCRKCNPINLKRSRYRRKYGFRSV